MDAVRQILQLHELDAILREAEDPTAWHRLGFRHEHLPALQRDRDRRACQMDPRWRIPYERGLKRYGRGITPVRGRVCLGCFVQLPPAAAPPTGTAELHQCDSCGRLLLWA